jgi:shikimate dehydrogenase
MTLRVALLGKPLKRRHSVVMHNAAFAAAGIDAEYVLRELDIDDVPGAVDEAREIGAVNNVVHWPEGQLLGFNTDSPGFRMAVEAAMNMSLTGANVVVAGAGGVAQAVAYACRKAGVARLTVGNRTLPASAAGVAAVALDSTDYEHALRSADVAVNATTVGMLNAGMTIPVEFLPDGATVFDCVYVPFETPLLAAARARGLNAANGSEMLIAQAALAFERWTGVGGMADVMRAAVQPLFAETGAAA